ncbi:hypothetical protein DYB36_009499, partial [Aphanomyces astaci]
PELIVHPYLGTATLGRITAVLPRLDALVLGPGLGRDPDVLSATKSIVAAATELQLPLVLDGDALYLLSTDVLLLRNYTNAILTPNTVETIYYALLVKTTLGHLTVLQKGKIDVISDGYTSTNNNMGFTVGLIQRGKLWSNLVEVFPDDVAAKAM